MGTRHFKGYSVADGNIRANISFDRLENGLAGAQKWLDGEVMNGMEPFMPMQTGNFIQMTRARSTAVQGSGVVCAGTPPMGRFLYFGKVMVGEHSRSAWAKQGEEKVVTGRQLTYARASAVPEWFEAAKAVHLNHWVSGVKNIAGKKNG